MSHALSTWSSLVFPTSPCLHVMNNLWSLQLRRQGQPCEAGIVFFILERRKLRWSSHLLGFTHVLLPVPPEWLPTAAPAFLCPMTSCCCWPGILEGLEQWAHPSQQLSTTDRWEFVQKHPLSFDPWWQPWGHGFYLVSQKSPWIKRSIQSDKAILVTSEVVLMLFPKWGEAPSQGSLSSFLAILIIPQACHISLNSLLFQIKLWKSSFKNLYIKQK